MTDLSIALTRTVSISNFNKGLAGKIFADVRKSGSKVVMKNNVPECVLVSPEEYIEFMKEKEKMREMAVQHLFDDLKMAEEYDAGHGGITEKTLAKRLGIKI